MYNPEVKIVFDLGGPVRPNVATLRDALLEKLGDPSTSTYEFSYQNARFRPLAGTLVALSAMGRR